MIDSMKKDILKEYINVFIGQAASLLSEMVNRRINLSVPNLNIVENNLEFCDREENQDLCEALQGHVMSTSIGFSEEFSGNAQLVFPTEKVKKLVSICMGEEFEDIEENQDQDFIDTDYDVVREIGNVILNAVVGGLSNLLGLKLKYSLPKINIFSDTKDMIGKATKDQSVLLLLHMTFEVADTNIKGIIINVLSIESMNYLDEKLEEMWADLDG